MKQFHIYTLTDPRDNTVRYVGCTKNPESRLKSHLYDKVNKEKYNWISQLRIEGFTPILTVVSANLSFEEAVAEEVKIFSDYNPSDLLCADPSKYQFKKNDRLKKIEASPAAGTIQDFLLKDPNINLSALSEVLYPNNKSGSKNYLSAKLKGARAWSKKDTKRVKEVLKQIFTERLNLIDSLT